MTIKFDNVYVKDASSVAGFDEKNGKFGSLYDKTYDDYYIGQKTFEQAEIKMIKDSVNILLTKTKKELNDIDVVIGADLLNQIVANVYSAQEFNRPFLGIYNACASSMEGILVGSSLMQNKNINNAIINISSHNLTAERQYRNPVEYGAPKFKRATFTVTGATSLLLTKEKTNIKVSSATIGTICNLGVNDPNDMGSVMTPAAARTIYEHLKDTGSKADDYDLILTGDLGVYGREILPIYMKEAYDIELGKNYEDSACIIYDRKKQEHVKAGGSGPACITLVSYTDVLNKLKNKEYKKVLLVATGALMNTTMNNQKLTIPSISHAVCLEAI